jgi:enoyl-CoA hydratase/carnithine racemase
MFTAAEAIMAPQALRLGLVDAIASDPLTEAIRRLGKWSNADLVG